jgi:predicted aspartyl protease
MAEIDTEIAAYELMRDDLEAHKMGKWVLIHDQKLVGTFDTFENAAKEATTRFGRGPYLISQVGASPIVLPASVMYNPVNARCGFNDSPGVSGSQQLVSFGPTLWVDIGFDPTYKPFVGIPTPGIQHIEALVDTGATECCIDNLLAAQLSLPIVNRRTIAGVHGSHVTNVYLGQVHVPTLKFVVNGAFAGVDLKAGGQVHSVLIGRTMLNHFTMTYEGRTGTVILSND